MHEHEDTNLEIKIGIVTISTSRFKEYGSLRGIHSLDKVDDPSGKEILSGMEEFNVVDYALVPDSMDEIRKTLLEILEGVDAIITTGGTGITPTDVTIEAVEPLIEKKIDGFGELFRHLSYAEVGIPGILSRTFAGVVNGKAIFCLPGSKKAVKLGVRLIRESLKHIISHARGLK
jgi:molybdenum cofactor biosynthesis protein B